MDPRPASFSEKVPEILQEIANLNDQADNGDARKVIQSEIFRKFEILEWILQLEEERTLTSDEATQLATMIGLVAMTRRKLNASRDYLNKQLIAIPIVRSHFQAVMGTSERSSMQSISFPFYLQLPQLVRRNVVKFLTAHEKINLIQAIPAEGELMGWDERKLQFETAFLAIMKNATLTNELAWKTVYNMSLISKFHRDLTRKFFDDVFIAEYGYLKPSRVIDVSIAQVVDHVQLDAQQNIFCPRNVLLNLTRKDNDAVTQQTTLLQRIGHRVRSCKLCLPRYLSSAMQMLSFLRDCLRLLPEVNVLHVVSTANPLQVAQDLARQELEVEKQRIANFHLPDCPSLKVLVMEGSGSHFVLMSTIVLRKYSSTLHHINVRLLESTENFNEEFAAAPALSSLAVHYTRNSELGLDSVFLFLRSFADSPLKRIDINTSVVNTSARFPVLMTLLSRHFGGTLEKFIIQLREFPLHVTVPEVTSSTWMADLRFRKVKYVYLDQGASIYGGNFLLLFPALEEIYFSCTRVGNIFDDRQAFKLSADDGMKTSNIWKLFPYLGTVTIAVYGYPVIWTRTTRRQT